MVNSFIQKFSYRQFLLKRKIEDIFIFPFVLIGRLLAKPDPLPKQYKTFFFFPFYHTGGAEKIHALIAQGNGGEDCIIFFSRKSADKRFLNDFQSSGCELRDISKYTDNKLLYFANLIWRGKISAYINAQQLRPVVFNGQSNFAYKISPWINKEIKQVELIHSFNTFSWIRIPFLPFITQTVMVSRLKIEEHIQQYKKLNVPGGFKSRLIFIQNAVELPQKSCEKDFSAEIKALFAGRGTEEKRPELFVQIANIAAQKNMAVSFTLAGDMPENVLQKLSSNTKAIGNINDAAKMHNMYCEHHLIIIPSSTEGFPIVLMEAMARGCTVMATPVGDIPYHIHTHENGFLFSSADATIVIKEAIDWLQQIIHNKPHLQQLCSNAKDYAFKNFGIEQFNQQYKAILHANS